MKVIKATQQMLETRTLVLGFQRENLRTQLRIDCSPTFAEYPNATPALAIKPSSGETYPVFVERDGNEVVWDIVANNLVLKGDGELQLTFYKDNVIAKTAIGTIRVNRSLQIDGEMPDVVATWIENANRKLAEVDAQIVELEGMVDTATDAATRAEQSASTASTKAEQAAGSAATATAKANEATQAAGTATAKAAEAQTTAQTATEKATAAADSERIATAKAVEATTAAGTATTKAEQAIEAAQTATEKAGDASASARAAHASEISAAESADDALSAEVGANAAKRAAETSATQAAISEQNAGTAAQTATQKAAEATQNATNAATFAGTATTKAEEAAASAQAAQDAKTAVEQTAEQLADSLEQISQNTADIAEHEQEYNALKAATLIHSTASGAIASFPDGAEMPVDEVTVQINPVQDLHGYDHPWPAGGGENILDPNIKFTTQTVRGVTLTTTDGYNFRVSGTGESGAGNLQTNTIPLADCIVYPAGTYTVTGMIIGTYHTDGSWYSNRGGTFTSPEDFVIRNGYREIATGTTYNTNDFISMAKGTTAPTAWTPYSNICPISGHTGLTVTRTGKNLLDPSILFASGNNVKTKTGKYVQLKKNVEYYLCSTIPIDGLYIDDKSNKTIAVIYNNQRLKYTPTEDVEVGLNAYWANSKLPSGGLSVDMIYLCVGSDSGYEPYQGETYEVEFPTEAGTVYGGSLTIAEDGSGVLTVDMAEVDLGTLNYGYNAAYKVFSAYKGDIKPHGYCVSSQYKYGDGVSAPDISCCLGYNGWFVNNICVKDSRYSIREDFKAAMSGVQLVYEIATPVTYTLTAAQITTLLGENNLWHDANGDISVGYKADTKLYIDGKIAELVARIVNS